MSIDATLHEKLAEAERERDALAEQLEEIKDVMPHDSPSLHPEITGVSIHDDIADLISELYANEAQRDELKRKLAESEAGNAKLREALEPRATNTDSYGVPGSEWGVCDLCGAEDRPGIFSKGIPHEPTCPLCPAPSAALLEICERAVELQTNELKILLLERSEFLKNAGADIPGAAEREIEIRYILQFRTFTGLGVISSATRRSLEGGE